MPESERRIIAGRTCENEDVSGGQFFVGLQAKQLDLLESLAGMTDDLEGASASGVKGEVHRLVAGLAFSIIQNPKAEDLAVDWKGLEEGCKGVLRGHHFQLNKKEENISGDVSQWSRKMAEAELRRDRMLG